jgi:predicted transcriptional regulator
MASELESIFNNTVKKSKEEITKAKSDVELEKILKELSLTEEEYYKFQELKDFYKPTLYSVNLALDDKIVGELPTRMSLFTAFILSKNNIYVSGPSASGKSAVMEACTDLVMPSDIVLLEGGSEKHIIEKARDIRKCKWLVAREINKIDSPLVIEILKSFGEGKVYQYTRSAIRGGYTTFELEPRPFVFSRADESSATNPIGVEVMNRLTEITVDSSQEQTLAVLTRQADEYENPFAVNFVNYVDRACLRNHISNIPEYDIYVNPCAQLLKNNIPTIFTSARRKFPQYIKNCNGIAAFHHKERITGTIDGRSVIFVTPFDIWYNHLIFGQNLIDAALQCSPLQKIIMQIIIENGNLSKQDIQQQLRAYSINQSIKTIEGHLSHLSDLGYLNVQTEGRSNYYSASSFYRNFDIKPNMHEILAYCKRKMESIEHYKPFAEEYISKFCDPNRMDIVHPYTGEYVNILTFDWESPFETDIADTRIQHVNIKEKKKSSLDDWI